MSLDPFRKYPLEALLGGMHFGNPQIRHLSTESCRYPNPRSICDCRGCDARETYVCFPWVSFVMGAFGSNIDILVLYQA